MKKDKVSRLLLAFVKITGFLPAMLYFKPSVRCADSDGRICPGSGRARLKGPMILMSNHKKLIDFVLYLMIFPFKTLRFQIAEVMYAKGRLFARFLDMLGGIKVDRTGFDFGFIVNSVAVLDRGGILGIFPEGQLPVGGKMSRFKPSIAVIALKTGVPVLPVYTDGSYGLFRRAHVIIGEPIIPPPVAAEASREDIENFSEKLLSRLKALGRLAGESNE